MTDSDTVDLEEVTKLGKAYVEGTLDKNEEAYLDSFQGPKLSKDNPAVEYSPLSESDTQFCGRCVYYGSYSGESIGWCTIIGGDIAQAGISKLFEAIPKIESIDVQRDFQAKHLDTPKKKRTRAVKESFENLMEAKPLDKTGSDWDVLIIAAGMSKNGKEYPLEVLHADSNVFEGVPVHAARGADHSSEERGVESMVGFIKEGSIKNVPEGIRGTMHISDPDLRVKLLDWHEEGVLDDMVGLSIVAEGMFELDPATKRLKVTKLLSGESVDLVRTPAAGGKILDVKESEMEFTQEELDKILEAAAEKGAATALKEREDDKEEEEEEKPEEEDDPEEDPEEDPKLKAMSEAMKSQFSQQNALYLNNALDSAKLPEHLEKRVRKMFESKDFIDAKELSEAIKDEKDYLASHRETIVESLTHDNIIRVTADENDKKIARIDAIFAEESHVVFKSADGKEQKIFAPTSFRESWSEWTGKHPYSVTMDDLWDEWLKGSNHYKSWGKRATEGAIYEALITTDWGEVTADRMHKSLIDNYGAFPQYQDWRKICRIIPASDFQAQRRIKVGGYDDLPVVAERGTYQPLTHPNDEETTVTVEKHGGIADQITREIIINDNVGAISRIPRELGRSAARTLYKAVFIDILVTNPLYGPDSTALFDATHNNQNTIALAVTGLDAATINMRSQTRFSSTQDILGAQNLPRRLVVPNELQGLGDRLVGASDKVRLSLTADTDNEQDVDRFRGQMEVIVVDDFTNATDYFLIADPSMVEGLVVAFLNGREEPELFIQQDPNQGEQFSMDVQNIKIRHEWNTGITDFRALHFSNVA